jgi:hypothetical protein
MPTANKSEKIMIGIDNEIIELTGADKEAFLEQRVKDQAELKTQLAKQEEQKALKVSAYTKLGLTKEEINAIV